jgi:hypothetical protein
MKTAVEMAQEAGLIQVSEVGVIGPFPEVLERFAALARADEREACAELAFEMLVKGEGTDFDVPDAIRARGQA